MQSVTHPVYAELREAAMQLIEAAKYRRFDKAIRKIQRTAKKKIGAVFQKQGKIFLSKLTGLRAYFSEAAHDVPWDLIFAGMAEATREEMLAEIVNAAEQGLTLGGVQAIKDLGLDLRFDLQNTKAIAFIDQYGLDYITGIEDTTREALRALMTESISEGWSYTETAKAIGEMFSEIADWRAELIAVTETGNAYSESTLITAQIMEEAGLDMEKSWLTAGDDKVEEECQGNADAEWIDVEEDFPSGDPRPLAHPRCRCTLLTRRAGSEDAAEEQAAA